MRLIPALVLRSRLAILGLTLSVVSAALFLVFVAADFLGFESGPYFGILVFLILPVPFVLGLVLLPIGCLRGRRWLRAPTADVKGIALVPVLDLNDPRQRRNVLLFLFATLGNLALLGLASYKGVHYMESRAFCGQVCHTVMRPQYQASTASAHARVACVQCHVGPGAWWFVRSKASGVGQAIDVARQSYPRPIPSPVRNLRPARETCEQCHWPEKFQGDRLRVIRRFADDEASSEQTTVLVLHVGGGSKRPGLGEGIHWHMNLANEITYLATDEQRQTIPWVRLKDQQGRVTEFVADDAGLTSALIAAAPKRAMDCLDCHNRPAHRFRMPGEAADEAIAARRVDRHLPFLKRQMVSALTDRYASREMALSGIDESIERYYRDHHPEVYAQARSAVRAAVEATREIYSANVFPEMAVSWGTYPDHLGHERFPGCFRCHDGNHRSPDGRVIPQDCDTCHTLTALQEQAPAILKDLGVEAAAGREGG